MSAAGQSRSWGNPATHVRVASDAAIVTRSKPDRPLRQRRLPNGKIRDLSRPGFKAQVSDAEQGEPYWRDIKGDARCRFEPKQARHDDQESHHEPIRPGRARHPVGDAAGAALMYSLLVTPMGQHD